MYVSIYEQKSHLKNKIVIKMLPTVERSRQRCVSDNLSCDNENCLLVSAFYTPISSFWEGPRQSFIPLSNFSTHSYQIILCLCENTFFWT